MLEDSQFHCLADAYLTALTDEIEAKDPEGTLDAEVQQGVLMITAPGKKQFLVSKHAPSHQLWLSSPVSGGLHFRYNQDNSCWELDSGRKLSSILAEELEQETGLRFFFPT
jgi:frataxin